jgi:hypothetical protein
LASWGRGEKLLSLFADGFLQFSVIDREAWAVRGVEFSESLFRLTRPGIRNQAQRVRVHPRLVLAASQPSARDLASSAAGSAR